MQVYHYDPDTGAFTGVGQADECQIEAGTFHIPAHATTTAPPKAEKDRIALFDVVGQAWKQVPDHRGRTLYRKDNPQLTGVVTAPGAFSADYTLMPPPPFGKWSTEARGWVVDLFAEREYQAVTIRTERNNRLSATDWTMLPDAPLSPEERAAYIEYRAALRNLPAATGWPNISFPEKPTKC